MKRVLKIIFGALFTVFVAGPFYWVITSSFKNPKEITQSNPTLFPHSFTLQYYKQLFSSTAYGTNLANSLSVSIWTVVISLLLVIPASYALYRMKFRGQQSIRTLMLITYCFPSILLLTPIYSMFAHMHLLNTQWSLIIMYVTMTAPFSIWLMDGFFDAVPTALDEAASVDGASRFRIVFRIILPLTGPGLASVGIYTFITAWTEYAFASNLIINESGKTLPVGLGEILGQYNINWGWVAAGGVLTLLPVLVLFALVGRFFVKGLTSGAVK